ncbi:EamA family transporter [Sphingomonas sp. BGYR3]|uniref:DMT family transporter n=1 Tax=Sphingomonas sp. BGYR3 TaxID=2975483 RepID=UPI0021A84723|nr:EamA family transporter [Sphingomonas sp. BGYR3]
MNAGAPAPAASRASVLIPFAIVTLIWGSTWIVIRDQLSVVPANWSVAYRFAIAGVAMLAWAAIRREPMRLDARGWRFAAMLGVTQFVLNFNFVYQAERFITSGLVAVVFALLIVPNAVLSWRFLGQRVTRGFLIGSAIAMAGTALLFIHELRADLNGAGDVALGIGITLLGVMSASSANVLQGTQTARAYPMATMLGHAMLIGAVIDALAALALVGPPVFDWRPGYIAGLLFLGIAGSAIAFPLYYGVIRAIGPARAAYNGVVVPVIAMLLSTLFEGYRWSVLAALGGVLVLVGLVVALRARRPVR